MTQPISLPSPYPSPGEVIDGKYQIDKILGEGGMGAVAKATHLLRRAPVALKFMSPAVMTMPGAGERFVNEAVAASQIDSDHVVKIFDASQMKDGTPYLVMEYLEGIDLAELLDREGKPGLPVPRAVNFILQALRGLQVAHVAGIVHRDMKPSNCFVITRDGEPDFLKLVDFGISKVQRADGGHITRTNSALGTPLYMSPEQARSPRDVDLRSDLYSVSVILYELLTGRTPFHSDTGEFTEILFKIFTMDPPHIKTLRPDLPDGLCGVIHHAMSREPSQRYSSAAEMAEALTPWADERSHALIVRLRNLANRGSHMPNVAPAQGSESASPLLVAPPQSIIPPSLEARATQDEARAKTQQGSLPPPRPVQMAIDGAPVRRTDTAVTREAEEPPTPEQHRRSAFLVAVPAVLIMGIIGVGAMKVRARYFEGGQPMPTSVEAPATATNALPQAPASALTLAPAPPPSATAIVTATASASAHPSATASNPKKPPAAPSAGSNTPAPGPTEVGDLKPHN